MTKSWATQSTFEIYAYLPINSSQGQKITDLTRYRIQPIHVLYENKYLTHQTIDLEKIKKIALDTAATPSTPVSFDIERGNRFKPNTVLPTIKTILHAFRRYNTTNLVGIYATIPQNTYGKNPETLAYERLNNPYRELISWVDFISPSLYNYKDHDFNAWLKNAKFMMSQAKKYPGQKPIIPYISPIIWLAPSPKINQGHIVIELTEQEMTKRLNALHALGASGCIIWVSSQDRDQHGNMIQFNPNKGWGKAVVAFIRLNHHQPA